jgi:hypothetical protein
MYQVSIKYIIIFHCKTLQNLPKFGILVLKTNHLATLVAASHANQAAELHFRKTIESGFFHRSVYQYLIVHSLFLKYLFSKFILPVPHYSQFILQVPYFSQFILQVPTSFFTVHFTSALFS